MLSYRPLPLWWKDYHHVLKYTTPFSSALSFITTTDHNDDNNNNPRNEDENGRSMELATRHPVLSTSITNLSIEDDEDDNNETTAWTFPCRLKSNGEFCRYPEDNQGCNNHNNNNNDNNTPKKSTKYQEDECTMESSWLLVEMETTFTFACLNEDCKIFSNWCTTTQSVAMSPSMCTARSVTNMTCSRLPKKL